MSGRLLQFYGWHDPRRGYLVSREPPDNPVRPALSFDSADEAEATIKRKRGAILWSPALPKRMQAHHARQS